MTQAPTRYALILAVAAVLLSLPHGRAWAQDELNIPGLKEEVEPTRLPANLQVTVAQDKLTLWGMIAAGGWCMWPLAACSIAAVALCVYQILELRIPKFCPLDLASALHERMHYAQIQNAYDAAKDHPSYLGQLFAHAIGFVDLRDEEELGRDRVEQALQDFSAKANRDFMLRIHYFSIIAQASPMLGLLGTVSGMIKAFGTMGREGMGDPSLLAANISEALITTAAGLIIAIPSLVCFFVFRNRLAQLVSKAHDAVDNMLDELAAAVSPEQQAAGAAAGEAGR